MVQLDRRKFLTHSSAAAASLLLSPRLIAQTMASKQAIPSRDTTLKFNADGTPKTFKGNTVISHLPVQCKMRDGMVAIHQELVRAAYSHKLGPTSTDSYHMTVFPGANDLDRTYWPAYVPARALIEDCNRIVGERMASAQFRCNMPLRVRIDVDATLAYPRGLCKFIMTTVDAEEEKKLRDLRNRLSEIYGFKTEDHDRYRFHMTMSYQMAPFTEKEWASFNEMFSAHVRRIAASVPILELGVPEYCIFDDMFRFEPQKLLNCS